MEQYPVDDGGPCGGGHLYDHIPGTGCFRLPEGGQQRWSMYSPVTNCDRQCNGVCRKAIKTNCQCPSEDVPAHTCEDIHQV